jgi:hypothetical protein
MTQLKLDRRSNTASISDCGTYRYTLTRELGGERTLVAFGLNPSKATAEIDDPTIRKDIGFAKIWGCERVLKINAYGYRATDPGDMKRARKAGVDTIGPDNDDVIRRALGMALLTNGVLLVAWGNHIELKRQQEIATAIRFSGVTPMCLGTNKNGTPVHELYQPYDRQLVAWCCP